MTLLAVSLIKCVQDFYGESYKNMMNSKKKTSRNHHTGFMDWKT